MEKFTSSLSARALKLNADLSRTQLLLALLRVSLLITSGGTQYRGKSLWQIYANQDEMTFLNIMTSFWMYIMTQPAVVFMTQLLFFLSIGYGLFKPVIALTIMRIVSGIILQKHKSQQRILFTIITENIEMLIRHFAILLL